MRLWTKLTTLAAGVAVLVLGMTAHAANAPIINSLHNMNNVFGPNTIENNEVCLPCHAPHNQPDQSLDLLWNHVMPTQSYTLYPVGQGTAPGLDETSRKCLSCHDGSVAVDSYGSVNGVNGIHTGTHIMPVGFQIGANGDLSHDHPVGVTYPGLSADGTTYNATGTHGFKDPTKFSSTSYSPNGQKDASGNYTTVSNYVNSSGNSIRSTGGSMSFGTTGSYNNIVGCGTCHTPHDQSYGFLHIPNQNSQLCLTCHDK